MENRNVEDNVNGGVVALVADVVAAYVSNNTISALEVPNFITDVHAAFVKAGGVSATEVMVEKQKPAVNPKKSVFDHYIICLEDGKKFKSLKRHLMTHYQLTPEQYREKWNLDQNYPMVAPLYAQERSNLAKQMGLGHQRSKNKAKDKDVNS